MVTIQPWIFITTCWSRQYDFNLVCHPCQDSNAGPRPWSENKYNALDRSAMDPLNYLVICALTLIYSSTLKEKIPLKKDIYLNWILLCYNYLNLLLSNLKRILGILGDCITTHFEYVWVQTTFLKTWQNR